MKNISEDINYTQFRLASTVPIPVSYISYIWNHVESLVVTILLNTNEECRKKYRG